MASYPNTPKVFSTKHNITDVVDQGDVNALQDEVLAIEQTLGVNPHISTARGATYADVKTRMEHLEIDYSINTHTHAHTLLTGDAAGDDHTQYMMTDGTRHDLSGRHGFGAALGNPGAATAAAVGDAAAAGDGAAPARENHRHGMPGWGNPAALTVGVAMAAGTSPNLPHADHVHAMPAAGAPAALAIGAAQQTGAAATLALSDHVHAMPGFGAVVASTAFGQASSNGVSANVSHADHTHGSVAVGVVGDITTAAVGDAPAAGGSGRAADAAHRHGMPSFGALAQVSTMQVFGIAPSAGTSPLPAHADHNHGTPDPTLQGPSGVIAMYGGSAAPSGWLFCDGTAVDRTTYATLFGIVGTRFGAGNGTTTFNLPDYRNRVPLGLNTIGAAPVAGNMGGHAHGGTTAAGSAHAHGASSAAGSAHAHSLSLSANTGAGSGHSHSGTTAADDRNHSHDLANHIHSYVVPDASGGSWNTTYPSPGSTGGVDTPHLHGFTTSSEAGHTHPIAAGSIGSEAGHNHGVTVNNEAGHTHGFGTDNQSPVAYLSVAFIIKT